METTTISIRAKDSKFTSLISNMNVDTWWPFSLSPQVKLRIDFVHIEPVNHLKRCRLQNSVVNKLWQEFVEGRSNLPEQNWPTNEFFQGVAFALWTNF